MILTDLDDIPFEIDAEMITEMHDRKYFREVRTIMRDILMVKETIPEIMDQTREEKRK